MNLNKGFGASLCGIAVLMRAHAAQEDARPPPVEVPQVLPQAKVVHIMTGTRDVAGNTGPVIDDEFENNIRAVVERAHAHQLGAVNTSRKAM
jgi:hypothetical protein